MRPPQNLPHHLNCVRTLLRKFIKKHFSVKNSIILCSFTFTAKENRKSISSYQIYSAAISTLLFLRVAIISNVQNVRLQRRHRLTDDASTRPWRGSRQTGPANNDTFITLLATFSLNNK